MTGGTGSIDRGVIRSIVERFRPKSVVVFSRDELKQSEMADELSGDEFSAVRYVLGDVRDRVRRELACRGVDVIVHAAALKQVPAGEYNPAECIHTNVLGAENVVCAAIRAGVSRVLALSSDKAVNPVNAYGASKLAAEKIFVAANNLSGENGPKFSIVRYGNVLGSRGSVVPHFLDLLRRKVDALPITDARMTRFWMTLRQSVDFLFSCLVMMQGGEIFVPRIFSARLADVAKALAPQLAHTATGIRPGEKLHQALIGEDEARNTVELSDRFVILPGIKLPFESSLSELPEFPPASATRVRAA